jgi:hypothetical protein
MLGALVRGTFKNFLFGFDDLRSVTRLPWLAFLSRFFSFLIFMLSWQNLFEAAHLTHHIWRVYIFRLSCNCKAKLAAKAAVQAQNGDQRLVGIRFSIEDGVKVRLIIEAVDIRRPDILCFLWCFGMQPSAVTILRHPQSGLLKHRCILLALALPCNFWV